MLELKSDVLEITLPEGKMQNELIEICINELKEIEKDLHGLDVKINGRLTTGMALALGHKLSHICKSVSIFDPKEKQYFTAIKH
jgi:hypothetical protein